MVIVILSLSVVLFLFFGLGCYLEGFVIYIKQIFSARKYTCRQCRHDIAIREIEEELNNPLSTERE
jgi:hypothetical protein